MLLWLFFIAAMIIMGIGFFHPIPVVIFLSVAAVIVGLRVGLIPVALGLLSWIFFAMMIKLFWMLITRM